MTTMERNQANDKAISRDGLDRGAVYAAIEETARRRAMTQSTVTNGGFNELEFFVGAMAALEAVGMGPPPPHWVLTLMRGETLLRAKRRQRPVVRTAQVRS